MSDVQSYNLDLAVERLIAVTAAHVPKFWGRISSAIEITAFQNQAAQDILTAVRDIAKDTGSGPRTPTIVFARLRRWVSDGKISHDRVENVYTTFDDADDDGFSASNWEQVLVEFAPILKARQVHAATMSLIEESARGADANVGLIRKKLEDTERLGERTSSIGNRLGGPSLKRISELRMVKRLPTGVPDLDAELEGGMGRGLGIFVAGTGTGKSNFMCHLATNSLLQGLHIAYATLELEAEEIEARVVANLTGIPINALLAGRDFALAQKRLAVMEPAFGSLTTQWFPPRNTQVSDIIEWVGECEEDIRGNIDLVIFDMAARLQGYKEIGTSRSASTYKEQGDIFTDIRNWLVENKKWGWTGDQPQRGAKDKTKIDTDDVSDSMAKARECDLMITATLSEDEKMLNYFIAKNRHAEGRKTVGPLPHNYAMGRMVPVVRTFGSQSW